MLLLGWVLLVLIFFSLSDGKRSLYIFPAAPVLALAAGFHAKTLLNRTGVQRLLVAIVTALIAVLVGVAMYAVMHPHQFEPWIPDHLVTLRTGLSLLAIGLLMATTVLACRRRILAGYSVAMVLFWIGMSVLVAPSLDAERSGRGLVQKIENQIGPKIEMGFVGAPEHFLLQWDKPVVHFGYRRNDQNAETIDAARWLLASPDRRIVLPDNWLQPCFDLDSASAVGRAHRRNWMIVDRESLSGACADQTSQPPELVVSYRNSAPSQSTGEVRTALTHSVAILD